jgi:hypothetical protein
MCPEKAPYDETILYLEHVMLMTSPVQSKDDPLSSPAMAR